ncbi:hypothetical protein ACFFRR_001840 [Megaselia abdita]
MITISTALYLIFLTSVSVKITTQCNVSVNNFVASFRFLNNVPVHIPEESLGNIDANFFKIICPRGFDDKNQPHDNESDLPLFCNDGKLFHAFEEHSYPANMQVNCKSQALTFFHAKSPTCSSSNIAIGYKIDEMIIVHAESCFDLFEMKVKYLHFVARPMSSLISEENNVINADNNVTVEFPEPENFEEPDELSDRLDDIYPDLNLSKFYSYFPLVSEKMFPIVRNSVDVFPFNMVNRAILLNELMENNWTKFELLLHERTLDNKEYDVFVGISNTLKVPADLKHVLEYQPKRLIYYPQRIPELLWAYLKSRNSSVTEELVVVGVNSIFLTKENAKSFEICEDVCAKYEWLDSFEKLRKISAFGYIYCCEVTKELKEKLEGFPLAPEVTDAEKQIETNEISKLGNGGKNSNSANQEEYEDNDDDDIYTSTTHSDYEEDYISDYR